MSGRAAVIAVTSVSLKASIASGPGVSVICDQASRLVASLKAAIERGAAGIISFGIAGGLTPDLSLGIASSDREYGSTERAIGWMRGGHVGFSTLCPAPCLR